MTTLSSALFFYLTLYNNYYNYIEHYFSTLCMRIADSGIRLTKTNNVIIMINRDIDIIYSIIDDSSITITQITIPMLIAN